MSSVIVLNASWEPLSRTKLSRAVQMVRAGIAVIHEAVEGEVLRSASGETMPRPKVLRLLRYISVKSLHLPAKWSKRGVLLRDRHKCGYCGQKADTVDHIVPKSRGGQHADWVNTVACCFTCNNKKASKTPQEVGMVLRFTPRHPRKLEVAFSGADKMY